MREEASWLWCVLLALMYVSSSSEYVSLWMFSIIS